MGIFKKAEKQRTCVTFPIEPERRGEKDGRGEAEEKENSPKRKDVVKGVQGRGRTVQTTRTGPPRTKQMGYEVEDLKRKRRSVLRPGDLGSEKKKKREVKREINAD